MEENQTEWSAEELARLSLNKSESEKIISLEDILVSQIVGLRSEGEFAQKGFYLNPDYNYKVLIDNQNKPVLLLLEK